MNLPSAIEGLITEFAKLPGIGRRSAERMAMSLVLDEGKNVEGLERALAAVSRDIGVCENCGYFTEQGECLVCSDTSRDPASLMVVERPVDVVALEKAGGYRGYYHVLGGHLSPLKGITAAHLRMEELFERAADPELKELILATSPSVEGDATALFISRQVRDDLVITRLGRGVPMGGALEFTDAGTLRLALESRRGFEH